MSPPTSDRNHGPLRFGGVPEAFNDPFSDLSSANAEFVQYAGGSGAMLQALQSREIDAAFMLTECAVAAQVNGTPLKIVCPVVVSPLRWAICRRPSDSNDVDENTRWGVSRFGSGSHIMVEYLASTRGWQAERSFQVCKTIHGLMTALQEGLIDAFLWEWYTTSPLVNSGKLKFVGDVPTPWSCFCTVVRQSIDEGDERAVRLITKDFLNAAAQFKSNHATSVQRIVEKYQMTQDNATHWLNAVQYAPPDWAEGPVGLSEEEENGIKKALKKAEVI